MTFKITAVIEREGIILYLKERGILDQYKKAKWYLLSGHYSQVNLKIREPKQDRVWSFRINKQYRAFGYFDNGNIFTVVKIDDH